MDDREGGTHLSPSTTNARLAVALFHIREGMDAQGEGTLLLPGPESMIARASAVAAHLYIHEDMAARGEGTRLPLTMREDPWSDGWWSGFFGYFSF